MNVEVPERVKSKQRYKANIRHSDTKFSETKKALKLFIKMNNEHSIAMTNSK